jgi:CRISPR/Cas system-associated exonuclease Cas4 (RecB family)
VKGNVNLFEHYYRQPPDKATIDRIRSTVMGCLEGYLDHEIHRDLVASRGSDVRTFEELTSFELEGTKIWVAMDLVRDEEGGVGVYDWKTGVPREADHRQLGVYALYAHEVWGVEPGAIRVAGVYLRDGHVERATVDEEALARTRAAIGDSVGALRSLLEDPEGNVAREEAFGMADEIAACRRCRFQEICRPDGVAGPG